MNAYTWFDGSLTRGIQLSKLRGAKVLILGHQQLPVRTVVPFDSRRLPYCEGKRILEASVGPGEWTSPYPGYVGGGILLSTPNGGEAVLIRLDLSWEFQSGSRCTLETVRGDPQTLVAVEEHVKSAKSAGFWPDLLIRLAGGDRIRVVQTSKRLTRVFEIECVGNELVSEKMEVVQV